MSLMNEVRRFFREPQPWTRVGLCYRGDYTDDELKAWRVFDEVIILNSPKIDPYLDDKDMQKFLDRFVDRMYKNRRPKIILSHKFISKVDEDDYEGVYYDEESIIGFILHPFKLMRLKQYCRGKSLTFVWIPPSCAIWQKRIRCLFVKLMRKQFDEVYFQSNHYQERNNRTWDHMWLHMNWCERNGISTQFEMDDKIFSDSGHLVRAIDMLVELEERKFKKIAYYVGYKTLPKLLGRK